MKKRQSIRTKLLRVTLSLLFIFTVVMGVTSIFVVNKMSKEYSRMMMQKICDQETMRFDSKLNMVKHSVDMIYEYARELYKLEGGVHKIDSEEYMEHIRDLAISVANRTEGAMAFYFRYDPEMVGNGTSGFFWSKKAENTGFQEETPTDILAYDSNDIEHVGWFFEPKKSGEPIWMTPYYNQNLDVFMISYIVPFYLENGDFVGVIGMDIDFNSIMQTAGEVEVYESGRIALVDMSERLVFYSDQNGNASKERLSDTLYHHISTTNNTNTLLEYTQNDGSVSVICCNGLANGMKLLVSVPLREIHESRDALLLWCSFIILLAFVVTLIIISKNTAKIIDPLNKLTEITGKYAQGDWSENYVSHTSDEIQELSECIATMAQTTQTYISRMNYMVRTDGLTGLKNKTCYLEYVSELTVAGDAKDSPYAVVVMDLNKLKNANDTYGHEIGDRLIVEAASYISTIFQHCDIFRIGGDEYVAILRGENFENRRLLCKRFEEQMGYVIPDTDGVRLSISFGMASYGEDGTEYEEIFRLADERMYERKKLMRKVSGKQYHEAKG